MSIYKDRFTEDYQKLVGHINCDPVLHENSKELVEVLNRHGVIRDDLRVFEIGAAGCRNLKYINDANPFVQLSANDLYKAASLEEMDESIRHKVNFYERDTLNLVREQLPNVDLLVASDHLMHIDSDSAKEIVNRIVYKWSPEYILLREVMPKGHKINRAFPRMHHDFDFGPFYESLECINSRSNPDLYYVQLLKRNY